jgi:phosphatidylglycerophosphate synthase
MLVGLYAGWLFSRGTYAAGVVGALLSLAASVLDGCDGELARLQYQESAFGCWVDTLGDYAYYAAVFVGLTIGAARQWPWPLLWVACGVMLCGGALLTFALLILLRKYATNGQPERLRARATEHFRSTQKRWARLVARFSTCATRATMPYGILGLAVLGLLPVAVALGALGAQIYWISLATEFRRVIKGRDDLGLRRPLAHTP